MICEVLCLLFAAAAPPPETAGSIMTKVAANQDRAQSMRSAFVYHQNVLLRMKRSNGKLAREEASEYLITPTEKGVQRQRTQFTLKYVAHGKTTEYHSRDDVPKKLDIDGEVVAGMADSLVCDDKSRDGIARDLFPLTAAEQKRYTFRLDGVEDYRGTPVYRILFEPNKDDDEDGSPFAGEALIDQKEFQPVLITTHQAFKVPLVVRTALGTNVEHLGFKVTYKKFDEGLWFPVNYGGEMRFRALFFYARRVGISVQNSGFERADVHSTVKYAGVR